MKLLLDTQALLWALCDSTRLSRKAAELFIHTNELYVSVASYWEIVTKHQTGKLKLDRNPHDFIRHHLTTNSIQRLNITFDHLDKLTALPLHHRDPFDRILVAQAVAEGMPILSADKQLKRYDVEVIW